MKKSLQGVKCADKNIFDGLCLDEQLTPPADDMGRWGGNGVPAVRESFLAHICTAGRNKGSCAQSSGLDLTLLMLLVKTAQELVSSTMKASHLKEILCDG